MAKTMIASKTLTDGQIDNLVDKFRAALRKHRRELTAEVGQKVLGIENVGAELYAVIRAHAERMAAMLTRTVTVDRSRSPQAALDATGRIQYTDAEVVAAMPRGSGERVPVHFFPIRRFASDDEVAREYERHNLEPADPYTLAGVNEADQAFADEHPNATHWKDAHGNWCFAAFRGWIGVRLVNVDRRDYDWLGGWWFAGVRK